MTRAIVATQYLIAVLIGLYLGSGQHLAYTSATVSVAILATIAARRSMRAARVTGDARLSARGAEPVESVAVTGVVEDDLDRHLDFDLVGLTLDDVRHHAGTLV